MNLRHTTTLALCVAISAVASAQTSTTDRNFQRLDKLVATKATSKTDATTPSAVSYSLAVNTTFPDTQFTLGGSFIYGYKPNANGVGLFQSTLSFVHANPSGGTISETMSETASYQLLSDGAGAWTIGTSAATATLGVITVSPYLAFTYPSSGVITITPTVTYVHSYGNGLLADGYVPDFFLTFTPKFLGKIVLFGDYTVATREVGQATGQAGFSYPIKDSWSLKFAGTASKGLQTGFSAQLGYKF